MSDRTLASIRRSADQFGYGRCCGRCAHLDETGCCGQPDSDVYRVVRTVGDVCGLFVPFDSGEIP